MSRTCGCDDCQSSRGRRKEFRQSAGMPEDEVPRRSHAKGKNKKHVHTYEKRIIGKTMERRRGNTYDVDKVQFVCTGCGNKRGNYWGRYLW